MKTDAMPVLDLPADPRARGRAHGEALRQPIAAIMAQWRETTPLPAGVSFESAIDIFLAETRFTAAIGQRLPALLDEAAGIAEGAGQDPRAVLAFQYGDEARWFFRDRFPQARASGGDNCSSLGARGDDGRATIVAENVDVGRWADGFQTLLRFPDAEGAQTLVFTVAGMLAMNGVSGRGVAICCNTLLQLDPRPDGLPVAAIVRGALACRNFAAAAEFVRTAPHASGQNYLLGGRRDIVNFECGGAGAVEYRHQGRTDRVIHTNHPLAHEATHAHDARRRCGALAPAETAYDKSSRARFESLAARFVRGAGPSTVEAVKAVLRARDDERYPVCLEPGDRDSDAMTIAATIFELGAGARLHIAAGPPSQAAFQVFDAAPAG